MKKVEELIVGVEALEIKGDTVKTVNFLTFDSRMAEKDSLFFAVSGNNENGNLYIKDAINRGAKGVVFEGEYTDGGNTNDVIYIKVKNVRKALSTIAETFYDHPSRKLKLVGVTGTNGKTTTATLLFELFRSLGYRAALISTVENKINEKVYPVTHTTPDPISLSAFLSEAVQSGCQYAFMECSSHAIDQERTSALEFVGGIFTNLTLDHLDYHKNIQKYTEAKKKFFDQLPTTSFALANGDDQKGKYMLSDTPAKKYFYGMNAPADFVGSDLQSTLLGLEFSINNKVINAKLIGRFNAYNILGIYAAASLLGAPEEKIISLLKEINPPAGRLQFVRSEKGIYGIVDYAHTPDALENILKTLNEVKTGETRIITVMGCGGDRDKTKRPIMGEIGSRLSDHVIFTSDNPRSEDPEEILKDIIAGVPKEATNYESSVDRAAAIEKAVKMAQPGDIIVVAGKGHENYQIFNDRTIHFSDIEEMSDQLGISK